MKYNINAKELISSLIECSDDFWYRYTLQKELYSKKMSQIEIKDVIKKSAEAAELIKAELIAEKGRSMNVLEYIDKFGLKLNRVEGDMLEDYLYMALYNGGRRTITLNEDVIKHLKNFIETSQLQNLVSINQIENVVLMHELFHHIESIKPFIYTRSKMLDRKLFGLFNYKRGINSASEIGAIHFSKLMTGLDYSPCVYEILLLLSVGNYNAVRNLINE